MLGAVNLITGGYSAEPSRHADEELRDLYQGGVVARLKDRAASSVVLQHPPVGRQYLFGEERLLDLPGLAMHHPDLCWGESAALCWRRRRPGGHRDHWR